MDRDIILAPRLILGPGDYLWTQQNSRGCLKDHQRSAQQKELAIVALAPLAES